MKNMQKCCPMRDSHDSMHTSQNAVCFKSPSALSTKVNSQAAVRIQTQPTSRGFRLNDICNAFASSPRTDAAVGCIGSGAGASFAFTLKQVSSRDSTQNPNGGVILNFSLDQSLAMARTHFSVGN